MTSHKYSRDPEHGFITVDPLPSQAELDEYYGLIFYGGDSAFNDSARHIRDRDREYLTWQFADIEEWATCALGKSSLSVLDVGCGFGHTLEYFKSRGHSVSGVEPSPEAAAHCQSLDLNVVQANVEDFLDSCTETFDLVVMYHVLEHVLDPREVLQRCKRVMGEQSALYLSTPNDFSFLQEVAVQANASKTWWFHPPRHINYFSHESLMSLVRGQGLNPQILSSDFPMEVFLLMGMDYISNPELGPIAHGYRVAFERALRTQGHTEKLRSVYQAGAQLGIGREIRILATTETGLKSR